jgi:hypothetical protein
MYGKKKRERSLIREMSDHVWQKEERAVTHKGDE